MRTRKTLVTLHLVMQKTSEWVGCPGMHASGGRKRSTRGYSDEPRMSNLRIRKLLFASKKSCGRLFFYAMNYLSLKRRRHSGVIVEIGGSSYTEGVLDVANLLALRNSGMVQMMIFHVDWL